MRGSRPTNRDHYRDSPRFLSLFPFLSAPSSPIHSLCLLCLLCKYSSSSFRLKRKYASAGRNLLTSLGDTTSYPIVSHPPCATGMTQAGNSILNHMWRRRVGQSQYGNTRCKQPPKKIPWLIRPRREEASRNGFILFFSSCSLFPPPLHFLHITFNSV